MAAKSKTTTYATHFWAHGKSQHFDNPQTTQDHWTQGLTDSRSDGGSVPNWRQKIRNHTTATTIVSGERFKVERNATYGSVNHRLRRSSGVGEYLLDTIRYRGYPGPVKVQSGASTVISDGVANREATKKYFRKVAAVEKSLDGLVFLGELRESLRMLRNPARSLFESAKNDYLGALGKRKKRDPKNWARGLSGAWLEWAYGVQPLVSDIKDIYDGLERFNEAPVQSRMITAVGRQTVQNQGDSNHLWSPSNNVQLDFSGVQKYHLKQKVKFRAKYVRKTSEIQGLSKGQKFANTFGLTLNEFVPTVWNLLPWSFLWDYFSNIGDILEQSFTSLANIAWVNRTIVDESVTEIVSQLDIPSTKLSCTQVGWCFFESAEPGPPARLLVNRIRFSRNLTGPSVSPLYFEIPGAPQKWLNMAALLVSANSVHKQRYF
jgi:hypothetical protein